MSSKRTKGVPKAEAPITGVATGSLGTAANLEDTQVLGTEDLQAAAPAWLDDDAPASVDEPREIPADEVALLQTSAAAVPDAPPAPVPAPLQPVKAEPRRRPRSVPALAGVAALFVLLLIAGAGIVSQLDLGFGAGTQPNASDNTLVEAAPSPTTKPEEQAGGGGNGKCHGHGHGKTCQGGED